MTPATAETAHDRLVASVESRLQQTSDRLKAVQADLDRAVAHEQAMYARLERRNSQVNQRGWREAWQERARFEDEARGLSTSVRALNGQLRGLRS